MSLLRLRLGRGAEARAARHLAAGGLRILARNVRTPLGELDVLCEDPADGSLVFVEVRAVASAGGPERAVDAVTLAKARQVVRAARGWLAGRQARRFGADVRPLRFDVVGVDGRTGEVEHVVDAFAPDDWDLREGGGWRRG